MKVDLFEYVNDLEERVKIKQEKEAEERRQRYKDQQAKSEAAQKESDDFMRALAEKIIKERAEQNPDNKDKDMYAELLKALFD